MEEAEREEWTERFLALICSEGDGDVLRYAASAALAGQNPKHSTLNPKPALQLSADLHLLLLSMFALADNVRRVVRWVRAHRS